MGNIIEFLNGVRYYAGWADKLTGSTYPTLANLHIISRREPLGVCGLISPWNFPIQMAGWKFMPALASGNAVVMKPSEETPLSVLFLGKLFSEIEGFPKGLFNAVPGYGHVAGKALTEHMDVDKISFTGSTVVGK